MTAFTNQFASGDRVQLAYVAEATFGTTPATVGRFLRTTGESLGFNLTKTGDKEITADAQPTSLVTTDAQAAGDIKVHMQYAEYDPLIAAVCRGAWSAYGTNGVGTTFSASITAGTLGTVASVLTAGAAPVGANAFTTLQPGQWFRLNCPANGNDGKLFRVSTSVAPTATTITFDVNTPAVLATAVANSTVSTSRLANGVLMNSFTIEQQSPDINQVFAFTGMFPSKFSTAFTAAQLTEGTFSFIGKNSTRTGATTLTGSTVASQAYDIHNGVTGVGTLWEAGVPLASTSIKMISVDIDSNLRGQGALGTLGLVGVGIGTISVKGSFEVYFANGNLYDKFLANTYTSLIFSSQDASGNGYVITIPKVQIMTSKIDAGGKNSDLMASFTYEAVADRTNANAALQKTIIIDRVGAAVTP
jgi:hypothetical protein